MYTLRRVWSQIHTLVSRTPVTVHILVCTGVPNTCLVQFRTHPTTYTHAHLQARLERRRGSDCARSWRRCKEALHVSFVRRLFTENEGSMQSDPKLAAFHHTVPTVPLPTPAHLRWCGANPPGPRPTQIAGHGGDPPDQVQISSIFVADTSSRHTCRLFAGPALECCIRSAEKLPEEFKPVVSQSEVQNSQ